MTWGHIFSCVGPFNERAVNNLDRSIHRSLWVSVAQSSFIEGSNTTKNMALELCAEVLLALLTNIRLGWRRLTATNALAYWTWKWNSFWVKSFVEMATEFIISLKRILLLSIWGQSHKTFLSVIYEFCCKGLLD